MPELVISDNEKAAVRDASRYEPDLNPTYQELATHYGTTVLPARPGLPLPSGKTARRRPRNPPAIAPSLDDDPLQPLNFKPENPNSQRPYGAG